MLSLADARRKAGDEGGAQDALQIVKQDYEAVQALGARIDLLLEVRAGIAAFEHHTDEVVAALRSAMQHGLRDKLFLDTPLFDEMRDEPLFIALQQEMDALIDVEHARVLQLICFNNPVPDDWQPLPETCEGVVEQALP